jgi:transcriptional regulator with XRE-family HTH domain
MQEKQGNQAVVRKRIAAKVRDLRQARRWSQAELAKRLGLSQNRLSEIERGDGSFTAEQFVLLLKLFNITVSQFVDEPGDPSQGVQNALARLGALHVQESAHVLPSEQLKDAHDVVREALLDGSPRLVTALAPVLVRNAERLNFGKLFVELTPLGRERRLAWVVENTLVALEQLGGSSRDRTQSRLYGRAVLKLQLFLQFVKPPLDRDFPEDVLDATIRSKRSLDEVKRSTSPVSRRWGVVSSLQPEDFLQALEAAHAAHR